MASSADSDVVDITDMEKKGPPSSVERSKKTSSTKRTAAPQDESLAKKPRAKKPASGTTSVDDLGWNISPPSLIYRDFSSNPSQKVAAFDLDGTLINTKSGAPFAKGPEDWKFWGKKVPSVLKDLEDQGYKIVLFSNQGGIKSALTGKAAANVKGKIGKMLEKAGVSALVMLATGDDDYRKPSTGMWDLFCGTLNGGVQPDKSKSFFVGDAAGRPGDWTDKSTGAPADGDKMFAANIGIDFKVPEDIFGEMDGKKAPPASVTQADMDACPNAEIVGMFKEISDYYFQTPGVDQKAKFKAIALKKAATSLSSFGQKASTQNLKEVGNLAGIGKGTLGMIKDFLETGKMQELEDIRSGKASGSGKIDDPQAAAAAAVPKTAAAAIAHKFM